MQTRKAVLILITIVTLLFVVGTAAADSEAGEEINWLSIGSSGDVAGTSTNYRLSVSVGQTAVGPGSSTGYMINCGFLQDFDEGSSGCCTGPSVGNVDGSADNMVTTGDLVRLLDHLFASLEPLDCVEEGNMDMSADGMVTMGDLTVLLDYLFISFTPLPPCP